MSTRAAAARLVRLPSFFVFALVAGALVAVTVWLVDLFEGRGVHPSRTLGRLAIGLAVAAAFFAPLVWFERAAERRFARVEAALRARRADATVSVWEGAEGRGLAFDGPRGRALLVQPPGGLGLPVLVLEDGRRLRPRTVEDLPPDSERVS